MSKLSQRRKRFAIAYIATGNIYQSALEAGYSENYAKTDAFKILENPSVKEYIAEKMKELDKENIARAEEVLTYLTSVMRGKETEQILRSVGDGVQNISEIGVSAKERIKAAELIGKRYGLWNDRVTLEGNACVQILDDIGGLGK